MKDTANNSPMPTPYELSKLAIMAGKWLNGTDRSIDAAVNSAMEVWEKSATAIQDKREAAEQLDILIKGLFAMPNDEWRARVQDYKGYRPNIKAAFERLKYPAEEVKRRIFPDKNISRPTRDKLMQGLATFMQTHKVGVWWDGHPSFVLQGEDLRHFQEDLKAREFTGYTARFLVEGRRIQVASNRRHGKP